MQKAELEAKVEFEMDCEELAKEMSVCVDPTVELPAREAVGVEMDGRGKVRRKPVPRKAVGEGLDMHGIWLGIGVSSR